MLKFQILKKSKISQARLGIMETAHGTVETPCLVPVATRATVKTLTSEEIQQTKTQILIANTFHLHLKPGEKIVKTADGLHQFMNWSKPLMTDSGGFQVFSLGFGKDFSTGKILASFPRKTTAKKFIVSGSQPNSIKITDDGVLFASPFSGQKIFLGPKESIKIQEFLGADIIFAFDECTSPLANYEYTKKSLERTHRWAKICLQTKKTKQSLFGIVQGGKFKNLREESAFFINSLPFDGFGIGGEFGDNKKIMLQMLHWVNQKLSPEKPRHLLGIGRLENIAPIIKSGIDTFDCIVPTRFGRHGIAFISSGKLDLFKTKFLQDKRPLDQKCSCFVCQNYRRNYISHLFRAGEATAARLLSFHNLYFFNSFIEKIRTDIKRGKF